MTVPVLIVDDDPVQRRLLAAALSKSAHEPIVAEGGEEALRALEGPRGGDIAAVILDLSMPGLDGNGVLKAMQERGIRLPVIVQTAHGGIETVVSAMRAGAVDFLVKPASPEKILGAITNALKVEAMEGLARRSVKRAGGAVGFRDLIMQSPAMERVVRLARKAAASNIPILIEGESGVGKELVARAIQGAGERRSKPFVTVNCGAIPANLVESILFGHEKGSFTGATEKHAGKFVEAHGGTLFLDEIGDLPAEVQVKLLRAVQSGEVDPVGARQTVKVDIRLISATHRDLLQRVKDGAFREDLYYRLNVFPIFVPPLRDRKEDIPALVRHFMGTVPASGGARRIGDISASALAMLARYDWPGNVRQLENAVFRASVLAEDDRLTVEDFPQIRTQVDGIIVERAADPAVARAASAETAEPPVIQGIAPAANLDVVAALDERGNVRTLADIELDMIKLAIDRYGGQMSEVARRLGIGRSTLYRKLKEYGIDPEQGRNERTQA
jgi:DNA-binding NtrC family response regulator